MPTERHPPSAITGVVFDIQRGSMVDGPGLRTTVFLKGCPLRCAWCHNPESWEHAPQTVTTANGSAKTYGIVRTVEEVMDIVRRDRPFYARSGGGLTISGGEPMASFAFTRALAAAAKAESIPVALDTSGWGSRPHWQEIRPLVDLFLFDLKHVDPEAHQRWVRYPLSPLLDTLHFLTAEGARIRLRCPLLPELQDIDDYLDFVVRIASGIPRLDGVDLLPHHRVGHYKYRELGLPDPPALPACDRDRILGKIEELQKKTHGAIPLNLSP